MAAQLFLFLFVRARHIDRHDAAPAVLRVGEDVEQVFMLRVPIDGLWPGKDSGQLRIDVIRYSDALVLVDATPGVLQTVVGKDHHAAGIRPPGTGMEHAVAVAEYVGGSEPAFAEMMNARAAELGMTNTHFVNACGLDEPEHLSTARDVAAMSREMLLHHTEVRDYCSIWMDTLRGGATQLVNTNKLLKSYSGITGLKTGTTGKAGVCISASAERDGLRLIAVVLGAASGKERFQAASTLLDYGFSHFESAAAELPADAPLSLPVERGTAESVALTYTAPERCLMPKGESSTLQIALDLPQKLAAPIRAGETVGTVKISNGSAELASYPVTAAQDVDALSFTYCLRRLAEGLLLTS